MTHLDIAIGCWSRFAANNPVPIQNAFYPSQYAISDLSAYAVTKEAKYADRVVNQLYYASSLEQNNLLLVSKGDSQPIYVHRDPQARQILHYYLAYRILGNVMYFHRAVYGADKMFRALPRLPHTINGEMFTLFTAEFVDPKVPGVPTEYTVDVNQNAEVGLAYALLAAEPTPFPQGVVLTKTDCKMIAMDETRASMLCQDFVTGAIPLSENDSRPDTVYGSYAAFCWTWIMMLDIFGPEYPTAKSIFACHVFNASNWLGRRMDLRTGSDKYYPAGALGSVVGPQEYTWRLPLYWFTYTQQTACFVEQIFAYLAGRSDDMDSYNAAWVYYQVMGFPLCLLGVS